MTAPRGITGPADGSRKYDFGDVGLQGAPLREGPIWSYQLRWLDLVPGSRLHGDYEIRMGEPCDVPALLLLQERCWPPELHETEEGIRLGVLAGDIWCVARRFRVGQRWILSEEGGGAIVGSGWTRVRGDGEKPAWHIHAIEIAPEVRRAGLGRALLAYLVALAWPALSWPSVARKAPPSSAELHEPAWIPVVTAFAASDEGRALLHAFGFREGKNVL